MKKVLIGIAIGMCLTTVINNFPIRTIEAEVNSINHENGYVSLIDTKGEEWIYEKEENDRFAVGEEVKITFNTNNTADIYDDEIIKIK